MLWAVIAAGVVFGGVLFAVVIADEISARRREARESSYDSD